MIGVLIVLSISFALTCYLYVIRYFNYWKERGIVYIKPYAFIGNLGPLFTFKCSIGEYLLDIYQKYQDVPYVGTFFGDKPCLVIRDHELVKRILHQDFHYFDSRMITLSKKHDPIGSGSLFMIRGKEWKNTRAKLSPIFTAKKQKTVFDAMLGVGRKIENKLKQSNSINVNFLSTCIAVDMISDAVLGFDGKAIEKPSNDKMLELGTELFSEKFLRALRLNSIFVVPELLSTLRLSLFPTFLYDIMTNAVKIALNTRETESVRRGDYIDALIDLKNKGSWEGNDGEIIIPTEETIVTQLFMFFTAGYETASSGINYCLYEAARNEDIQQKLRFEIDETIKKCGGCITYEALHNMSYLNKYITECLRKNPPFPFIDRRCTADYTIPGTNIVINKGCKVMIPMLGLHMDEKYYNDPESIIPERFDDINNMKDKPYFPFGTGPRTCLGMRYALQLLKIVIVSCLKGHRLTVAENIPEKIRMNPKRFGNTPLCDVVLNVHAIQ